MGRSGSESSRSRSSRDKSAGRKKPKHETKKDKKDKKHKHDEGGQASLPGASASSDPKKLLPADVSLGDVFLLVQSLSKKIDKVDALSDKMSELAVNQANANKQLSGVESKLDGLDARVIKLEENKSMPASSSDGQREMPKAGVSNIHVPGEPHPHHVWGSNERGAKGSVFPPIPPSPVSAFDRPGWPNVIQCNTQDGVLVTREVIKEFFAKALENKGLACDLDVNCRFDTDKKFSVAFNAPGNVGQECAKALLRTKKANGQWQTFHVSSPSGAQVQLHFDPDKGPKQVKLEITTNKFTKMLKEKYSEKEFYCRKDAGKIFLQGAPIACIEVSDRDAKLEWFKRTIGGSGIDKDAMRAIFNDTFCEEWCS